MNQVNASAPGKIVISGEYAVLRGSSAVAMAVDCRAKVSLRAASGEESVLSTRGFADATRRFRRTPTGIGWLDPLPAPDALSLFEAVLFETGFHSELPVSFDIDSRAFADEPSGEKFGFGSSAAVAAALTAACLAWRHRADDLQTVASRAHSRHQSGKGSGVDVAASVSGGLIRYVRGGAASRIDWPPDLGVAILWSGRSAKTAERITGLDTAAPSPAGESLEAAAAVAAAAWSSGRADAVIDSMQRFVDSLSAFEAHYRRGIFDAGHRELVDSSADFPGIVYKPCGAGGGDVGVALGTDRDSLAAFVSLATESGFRPMSVGLDPVGAKVEGAGP